MSNNLIFLFGITFGMAIGSLLTIISMAIYIWTIMKEGKHNV